MVNYFSEKSVFRTSDCSFSRGCLGDSPPEGPPFPPSFASFTICGPPPLASFLHSFTILSSHSPVYWPTCPLAPSSHSVTSVLSGTGCSCFHFFSVHSVPHGSPRRRLQWPCSQSLQRLVKKQASLDTTRQWFLLHGCHALMLDLDPSQNP